MTDATSPGFLIRCRNESEYPFCLDDDEVDKYWLLNADVLFRAIDKSYKEATQK